MPKRISRPKRPTDPNEWAHQMVNESTSEKPELEPPKQFPESVPQAPITLAQISTFMAEMGRKGGKIGGKRRLETMTKKAREVAARKAAKARWSRVKKRG